MKTEIYESIRDRIVADLERGVRPWMQPWAGGALELPIRENGVAYQGINIVLLWDSAIRNGFTSRQWMTYKQAQGIGAQVRKGAKGSPVVFAGAIVENKGTDDEHKIPYLKHYTVFNSDQIEGLPETESRVPIQKPERIERAERFFAATGARIEHGGARAYYTIESDYIRIPTIELFKDSESYYATLAHETTHWTRHPSRLNRKLGRKRHGDEGYAREELVAELGSAFLCADLGISLEPREDHAAYIATWIGLLNDDPRAIFEAASHAQKAMDYLHGLANPSIDIAS